MLDCYWERLTEGCAAAMRLAEGEGQRLLAGGPARFLETINEPHSGRPERVAEVVIAM